MNISASDVLILVITDPAAALKVEERDAAAKKWMQCLLNNQNIYGFILESGLTFLL